MAITSEYVTREEFAIMARLSTRSIDRYREKARLNRLSGFPRAYLHGGHKITFKRADVDQWLASRALW